MLDKAANVGAELSYQFEELLSCIHLKALIASLPVAYTAHFLGDWHLIEVWFGATCVDLLMGIKVARKSGDFSWDRIGAWTFKLLVHGCTIIVVGVLAHVASVALKYNVLILNLYMAILITKELGSTVRNMRILNWPVPRILLVLVSALDKNAEKRILDMVAKISNSEHLSQPDHVDEHEPEPDKGEHDDLHSR